MIEHVLIAGWGAIAQRHARNLRALDPDCRVTVLRASGQPLEPAFAWIHRSGSLDEAISSSPDAAIIATPSTQRLELVRALGTRGIPLLIEKPLASTVAEAEAIRGAAASSVVLLGYNLRFHGPLKMLRDAVAQGRIGESRYLRAEVGQYLPDWRPGRDYTTSASAVATLGGGALLELSHEIDLALWLLGEPRTVQAWTGQLGGLRIDVEDTAELTLHCAGGALASVHLDFLQRVPRRSLTVVGSEATITWDLQSDQTRLLSPGGRVDVLADTQGQDRNGMYLAEMKHFLACCNGDVAPAITLADGVRILRVVDAARIASADGKTVTL